MIRKRLAGSEGERRKFRARFERFGKKAGYTGYSETTVLLKNVTDVLTNEHVTDHLWFAFTKGFENLHLEEGMIVEFEARVKKYAKGYVNKSYGINQRAQDYKLSHPTRIAIVQRSSGR